MDDKKPHYHGHRERLRRRFLKNGRPGLADYEIVELLLTLAIPRRYVNKQDKGFRISRHLGPRICNEWDLCFRYATAGPFCKALFSTDLCDCSGGDRERNMMIPAEKEETFPNMRVIMRKTGRKTLNLTIPGS